MFTRKTFIFLLTIIFASVWLTAISADLITTNTGSFGTPDNISLLFNRKPGFPTTARDVRSD